jgi:SAM-dependent methyltransferase
MTAPPHEAGHYLLDNDVPTASDTLNLLAEVLDEVTVARLTEVGVSAGARCLELGAGVGSIAAWLADQVGPTGQVIATDIKPQHVRPHPGVTVLNHNVATDPFPDGPFDLIHARLLLAHLPQRHAVLAHAAAALAPGGALVIEEWGDPGKVEPVLSAPDPQVAEVYGHYSKTLIGLFAAQGNDTSWLRRVNAAMLDCGLVDVQTVVQFRSWQGGTAGCLLPISVSTEVRDRLIEAGMTAEEIDALHRFMRDPKVVVMGNPTHSTVGRRPRA